MMDSVDFDDGVSLLIGRFAAVAGSGTVLARFSKARELQ